MRYYPIFLNVENRPCTVVGGGRVAERRVRTLLACGARVQVISPQVTRSLAQWARKRKLILKRRAYRPGDLVGSLLAFAATNHPAIQQAVAEEAARQATLVNLADDREGSNFLVPASFSRGPLEVAVSTGGSSPALARKLRQLLERWVGHDSLVSLRRLGAARRLVKASVPRQAERARIFRKLAKSALANPLGLPRSRGTRRAGGKRHAG